jgi:broad specificity phosphatase PhoE
VAADWQERFVTEDDYFCVTVKSHPSEDAESFNRRLIAFWSRMIREQKDAYVRVYAETSAIVAHGDRASRQYLVGSDAVELIARNMREAGVDHDPVDADEVYSRFEATSPDWFQIPH